ncbi:MAG: PilZ domain-containing protein, partial [Nitrospirota bacterium]|nr:PilZ domain-containing protein [Nitrospirota bacterium]
CRELSAGRGIVDTLAEPRYGKRIPCKLSGSRSTFSGLVLDVSRTGLFVQTSAVAKAGDEVEVMLARREPEAAIVLDARVVWQRNVPRQLQSVVEGGLGLQIRYAPEPYYALLAEVAQGSAPIRRPVV